MLHDPNNHDEVYQSGVMDHDYVSLCDEFAYHYEAKLDAFQDKVDSFRDMFFTFGGVHPDKLLARYDKRTSDYLENVVLPFFEEMKDYYGPNIMGIYQEYADQLNMERASFIKDGYNDFLQDYNEEQEYKKLYQQTTKKILELLKQNSPIKQAALVNSFEKEHQSIVRKCLKELLVKGRIIRAKKDLSKNGVWFLCFVK